MPYTDWNYTNPGWTNNNPPAINESNLNDIANALSKLNLTSEQLSQLGLTTANGLSDIISKLVENISDVNTALSKKGTLCVTKYTYVGNGTDTVSIDISNKPYDGYIPSIAFVYTSNSGSSFTRYCICIYGAVKYVVAGTLSDATGNLSFTQNMITMSNANYIKNNSRNVSYNVIVI